MDAANIAAASTRDAVPRGTRRSLAQIFRQPVPMRRSILEVLAAIALTLAAILTSAPGVLANDVMVIGAFARASATPGATSAVVYVTLANHGAAADRLMAISTPAAAMAEVHQSKSADGVTSMDAVPALDLPPGETVAMKPGGLHIMLMGLKAPLKRGETLTLELSFEKAGRIVVTVPVGGVAANGPDQVPAAGG